MKKIAAASGISKATIGRHLLKCLSRHTAEKFKALKLQKPIVSWPDNRHHRLFSDRMLSVAEVNGLLATGDFCVWEVCYTQASDEAKTNAAAYKAAAADIRAELESPADWLVHGEQDSPEEIFCSPAPIEAEPKPEEKPEPSIAQQGRDFLLSIGDSIRAHRRCG